MSKKVLIISSTLRKGGNSDILCDEFAARAKEAGNAVEKIASSWKCNTAYRLNLADSTS